MSILLVLDHSTFGDEYIEVAKNCAPYCEMIWYRPKELTVAEIYERAARLRDSLPKSVLMLSEHAGTAHMLGFDGVHLGEQSMPVDAVRETFKTLIIGYSAHTTEECAQNADYFTLSPVFNTNKPYNVTPLGAVPAPRDNVYALGGINKENITDLTGLGYKGVAGISLHRDIEDIYHISLIL